MDFSSPSGSPSLHALAEVQLSGVFRLDSVESVLRSLELGFGVQAERADGRVVLRLAAPAGR